VNPKIGAKRLGMSVDEYERRTAAGEKWCTGCKDWHPVQMFGPNGDGYQTSCRTWRSESFRRWLLARVLVK
jgi:hypothetical protein